MLGALTIEIFDSGDALKKTYTTTTPSPGEYTYTWDGKDDEGIIVPDGDYSVKLTAVLSSDTSVTQEEAITVIVDATAPVVDITQPEADSYFSADLIVNGTISDENLLEYSITYTGEAGTELLDSAGQSREDYTFGILNDFHEGSYTLNIEAKDSGENITVKTIVFTIDRTPPKVTFDTPEEGEYYGSDKNTITITGSIIEENLETYSLRYGSGESPTEWTELLTGDTLPVDPQLFVWKVGKDDGIPDGLYTLSLYAKDKAGFEKELKVKITIDNTPPEVLITLPEDGSYVKESIDIRGTAFDRNLGQYTVEFSEGDCSDAFKWASIKKAGSSALDGALATWQTLPPDNDYCLRLTAVDELEQKAEAKVNVKVDTHPPVAPVLSGEIENKTGARLTWTQNTEPDLAGYNLYRSNQKVNTDLIAGTNYLDQDINEGNYTYTVRAVDLAGWESEPSNEIRIAIDLTGPDARVSSPGDSSKVSGLLEIKGTAYSSDDFRQYRVHIGQGPEPTAWSLIRTSPVPISYGTLTQWDTTGLGEGEVYSIKLETEDISGNINTDQISVTIDNTPPAGPLLISAVPDNSDVTLTWEANTEPDLAGYLLYRNDQLVNVPGIVIGDLTPYLLTGTTYSDEALPDGRFKYYLAAMDSAGNISDRSNTIEVNIDTHPPQALIVEPEDSFKFEDTILIRAESPDLDITSIQFEYKKVENAEWINLGDAVTTQPYMTSLYPVSLVLIYGDYNLRAVAVDGGGQTDPSPSFITVTYTDLTAPEAPVDLNALTNGQDVTLAWTANTEADLDGYNIYRTSGEEKTRINTEIVKDITYTDSGLPDGTYEYEITAIDIYGNESLTSGSVPANIYAPLIEQPYTPAGENVVLINGSDAEADSTVEIYVEDVSGYWLRVTTSSDLTGRFNPDATLAPGENRITAKAIDSFGNISRASDEVVVVYNEPPAAPAGLTSNVNAYDVNLAWESNTEADLSGYNLYRNGEKINEPSAITSGSTTASYNYYPSRAFDSDLSTYWYVYSYGNPVWWQIDLPSSELISHIEINWASEGYAGKDFEIQVWSGYAWITQATVTGNNTIDNAFDFSPPYRTDKIRIYITDTTDSNYSKQVRLSEVEILKDNLITDASYDDVDLDDGEYAYKVTAVDYYGFESLPSDDTQADVGDVTPPSSPLNLSANASGSDITLNWTANSESDLSGYNIYRDTPEGWIKINMSIVTAPTYTDQNLANGTYTYRITAVDNAGNESGPSNEASADVNIALLAPPVNLSVSPVPEGEALSATWEYESGSPAGYNIYRSAISGGPYTKINDSLIGELTYVDSGLTNNTAYYYVVVAVDSSGNESAYSNEAVGMPGDITPPSKPEMFLSRECSVRFEEMIDISGSSEQGVTIELYKDGEFAGRVAPLEADVFQDISFDFYLYDASLSSDGKTLAYSYNNSLWLMDISTGSAKQFTEEVYEPVWSLDGRKIAYIFYDSLWNSRIGIYDVDSGTGAPLTADTENYFDEFNPSWSSDGNIIVFVSNIGGYYDIRLKDLSANTLTQVTNGINTYNPKISPDGGKITYFVDSTLYIVEIESGLTTEVDADTDGESTAWSPDSGELAFISYQKGPADLYVFNLAVQSLRQITNDLGVELKPAWSPNGASIVFERREQDWSRSVAVVNTRSMESRILYQNPYSLYYLDWTESGKIAYVEQKTLFTAELKGEFRFSDIQMDPGENIFYVQAVDPSGNARASDEVCVIYDTSLVPDPEITTEDIFIYPPYPVEGEEVSVIVTIKNKAQHDVNDVDVDIYLWDPAGNLELVHSETLPYIAAGSEQLISLALDSTGRSGVNTVIAVIDPEDKIHELSETNNYASREFVVVEEEGVSMTTTIDSGEYESNEDVNIDVALINSGFERDVIVEVRIEDENGDAVTLLDTINTRLEYGLKKNYDFVWNTGSSYAGSYRVHSIHKDDAGVISENIVPFTLLPDMNIDLTVVTDKTDYDVGEDVLMYINVKNSGNNYAVPELTAKVKITDINSNEQFTDNTTVTNLLPGVTVSLNSVWNTGSGAPGDYTAFVEIYVDGRPVESESAFFGLNGSIKIAGSITATPPVVSLGDDVYADYTVRNNGSVDADGLVLKVLVMDPETQAVINTFEDVRDLAVDSAQTGRFVFSSAGYELKTYSVVLQYSSGEGTGRIDSASFTVRDGTPPAVSVLSPVPGAYYTSTVSIAALVSDHASGVDKVEYQLDDGSWRLLPVSDLSQGRYSTTWTPGLLSDEGSHSVSVRAYDKSGNISAPAAITFTVEFIPPVADAGPDRNVITGEFVILDGSGSYDPEGETITFLWMFAEAPAASAVTDESLSDVTSAKPAFTPDVDGTYVLELTVSDGKKQDSDTVSINATTPNVPPNADAGPDRNVFTGNVVYLDGSGSNDPDNGPMPLSYNWSFDVLPPESVLSDNDIIDKEQVNSSFIPDADGSYILKLVVNDGEVPSEDYVLITAATPNVPPNADAGDDITVSSGETAILDGSASNDPDNGPDSLAYSWSFVAAPADSGITNSDIFDADTASPSFIPDAAGTYVLELMVEDGLEAAFDNVAVTVVDVPIISVSPTSIDFGDLDIGLYSDPQAITVLNESSAELVISDINISGADRDEFSQTNDCATIGAGSACAINVTFSPGETGIKNALLGISSNDPDTPSIFVPLTGNGVDITPPEFLSVTVNRDALWPPNHKMVDIVIEVEVTDNSGLPVTLSAEVRSNEPVSGKGAGNTSPDWTEPVIDQDTGTINLQLRAERSGSGTGRIYTITINAADTDSNSASTDVEVTVPHDNCNC